MSTAPLLRVAVSAEYPGKAVLHDARFDLQAGEILGLLGTSGAGKSTLVLSLLGLLQWRGGRVHGEILFDGLDLLRLPGCRMRELRGRDIALIPQSPMTSLNVALSLSTHFREAWRAHEAGVSGRDARVRELLTEVQLPSDVDFLKRRPSQISVGQAQRVLIALALLHRPRMIVADEPTSALDPVTQAQVNQLLRTLSRKHGTALLYISHDLLSVLTLADRIAVLDSGRIVEDIPVMEVAKAQHPAARALLGALPVAPEVLLSARGTDVGFRSRAFAAEYKWAAAVNPETPVEDSAVHRNPQGLIPTSTPSPGLIELNSS